MVAKSPTVAASASRKPRADALRNRARILQVARQAFMQHGAETSLDDIARRAEVGAGTLYRHFPTREALIEAVFHTEVSKLAGAGTLLQRTMPPLDALRSWMLLFVDYVADKLLILPALDTVSGGSARLIEGSRGPVHGTFLQLIRRAIESGDLSSQLDPQDIARALIGTFHTAAMPGWEASARRIVDLLIAGARANGRGSHPGTADKAPKRKAAGR